MNDFDYTTYASDETLQKMEKVSAELNLDLTDLRVKNELYFVCSSDMDNVLDRAARLFKDGIDILEMKQDLYSYISDAHKDAHGFRLRLDITDHTVIQLCMIADRVERDVVEAIDREKGEQELARENLEKEIAVNIELGAGDRETAIRWIVDQYDINDLMYGTEYIEFDRGLQYNSLGQEWKDAVSIAVSEISEKV